MGGYTHPSLPFPRPLEFSIYFNLEFRILIQVTSPLRSLSTLLDFILTCDLLSLSDLLSSPLLSSLRYLLSLALEGHQDLCNAIGVVGGGLDFDIGLVRLVFFKKILSRKFEEMEDMFSPEVTIPADFLEPFLNLTNSSILDEALENLIATAKTKHGRSELASKNMLPTVLDLIKSLRNPTTHHLLLLSLKLLRNLCAGEILNQTSFIKEKGPEIISVVLKSVGSESNIIYSIVQTGLQLLGNVSLAGEEHQRAIWACFFPIRFLEIARVRRVETCDPLCMIMYTCSESNERFAELCEVHGLTIVAEIIRTASTVGSGDGWMVLLLSKVCFEASFFPPLFTLLCPDGDTVVGDDFESKDTIFTAEQAFLLSVLSDSLNQQSSQITMPSDFILFIFKVLKRALASFDSSRSSSGLPTGFPAIDVLGYSISILRDVCADDDSKRSKTEDSTNVVDCLISLGLLDLLLDTLRHLEPPEIIRKSISRSENQNEASNLWKVCPYKGFRRDIVAVIANCLYHRKHAQDEVRHKNGILLLMQQCVTDEHNPFLREWGLWSMRNLLEGNEENKREVAAMEIQGPVDVPEITELGLRVEVDQKTRQPKLVNVSPQN